MKVIVTGGFGFIGSHIVDRLIEDGLTVIVIDNESAECHEQFYHNPKAHNYKFDICDYENIRPLFEGVDYVFHLAAEARIQPSLINPLLTVRTNSLGTSTILQCAREARVKRVIYSSTSSAYGRKHYQPQSPSAPFAKQTGTGYWWKGLTEDMEDDCLTPYSVSKVSGEKMCKMYSELFGLDTVILRYFNVYGEREPTKGQYAPVIGLFLRQIRDNKPMTIVGDGEQRRDFTNIEDVVRANIMCMNYEGELKGEMFNIGTGKNYSINELADIVGGMSNTLEGFKVYIPERKGESRVTLANINKAREILGWFPKRDLEDYLKR
jgi:UDP-glucose 4-epimerase